MTKLIRNACLSVSFAISFDALAAETKIPNIEEVLIIGSAAEKQKLAGSGVLIDTDLVKKQAYTDLNQIISMAPGVYVREEDGYGLRPNIGIRGATAERSQKITLMEDGVLIAPAPYSAPAAYYMTNASRLHALEVLKGPSSIAHGPHTVGGAVNLVTRPAQWTNFAEMDLTVGTDQFQTLSAQGEFVSGDTSYLVDALHYASDGFKELDDDADTGFVRNDFNIKVHWQPQTDLQQSFIIKLGYADEDANETYLGLTDEDFDNNPNRRYPASQLDRFISDHSQLHLSHSMELSNSLQINSKLYFNQFNRSWNKFDGFIDGTNASLVLQTPSEYLDAYQVLTGSVNSTDVDLTIDVTDNDREYSSDGIQIDLSKQFSFASFEHNVEAGIRYHQDDVHRNHQQRSYLMDSGRLVSDGIARPPKVLNYAKSQALALYLNNELSRDDWTINVGLRFEEIDGSLHNKLTGSKYNNSQSIVAPGLGVHKKISDKLGVLAGVYLGFSPAGPGKSGAEAEESVNFEYGVRYQSENLSAEAIGFFSDYENLLGRCRASDANCAVGEEFNGGQVEIGGIELSAELEFPLTESLVLDSQLSFTYTESAFQNAFLSQFSQWGLVQKGDELPYVPKYAARWQMGIGNANWSADMAIKYQHEMREVPGVGDLIPGQQTESLAVLDLSATWMASDDLQLKLMIRNATNESAIVSHRPYAARPNLPRMILGQIKYRFNP